MSQSTPQSATRSRFMFLLVLGLLAVILLTQQIYFAGRVRAANPFTAGNLVVYRVGDGGTALSGNAAPVFLDEYTPTGTLIQSIPLPTVVSSPNRRLTSTGTSTNDGFLTLSTDGQYLVLTGYDADVATVGVAGTTSTVVNRVIGRVDASAVINTSTVFAGTAGNSFSTGNVRSVTSDNGNNFWANGSTSGVQYIT